MVVGRVFCGRIDIVKRSTEFNHDPDNSVEPRNEIIFSFAATRRALVTIFTERFDTDRYPVIRYLSFVFLMQRDRATPTRFTNDRQKSIALSFALNRSFHLFVKLRPVELVTFVGLIGISITGGKRKRKKGFRREIFARTWSRCAFSWLSSAPRGREGTVSGRRKRFLSS